MERLAQYLHANHLTQTRLAGRLGVSQATISRLLSGKSQPSAELARRIEDETGGAVRAYDWPAYSAFRPPEAAE